ncbi:ABC transporter [Haladaptatus sp. R4]|uniref:ABC transporter permease n=1 Tax=Haladaptatus sp. R4 TaxID=1679489 RepID=UPI0007B47FC5|nr:ABC transporter permease [Haladaptatus sp. R4]KZN24647.1 ABC transporter [Haladaptatus sp. R4]
MSTINEGLSAPGNGFLSDTWVILKRWLVIKSRDPMVLIFTLFQPVVFLVLFSQVFGGATSSAWSGSLGGDVDYVTYLIPAIVIQSAFFAAGHSGVGLTDDMETGMLDKIFASPIHRGAVILGKTLAEVAQIVVQTLIILVLGYVLVWLGNGGTVGTYVATGFLGALGIIAVAMVFAVWFAALSNIIAAATGDGEGTATAMMLLQFPMLFLSSAFLPLDALPDWVQIVAKFNPFTYGTDAARALMLGPHVSSTITLSSFDGVWSTVVPAVVILGVLDIVLGVIAVRVLTRTLQP